LLQRALISFPEDPQRNVVQEWILARLHAATSHDRIVVAHLVPLVLQDCDDEQNRRLIQGITRRVRQEWEMPPFMESRLDERLDSLIARAEALLLFGFWSAHPRQLQDAVESLLHNGLLEPRHVADALFGLLELDSAQLAEQVLSLAQGQLHRSTDLAPSFLNACRCSILAAQGELSEASELFGRLVPDAGDRVYNGTRLRLARAQFIASSVDKAFRTLRLLSDRDHFAQEHRTQFQLMLGNSEKALSELEPLLARGNHKRPRDMTNFLYCASLLLQGKEVLAREVAGMLPQTDHPRTWTLASYYLADRLGEHRVRDYLSHGLPWERRQLCHHFALLERCRSNDEAVRSWSALAAEPLATCAGKAEGE
jgi:hypothetical protein